MEQAIGLHVIYKTKESHRGTQKSLCSLRCRFLGIVKAISRNTERRLKDGIARNMILQRSSYSSWCSCSWLRKLSPEFLCRLQSLEPPGLIPKVEPMQYEVSVVALEKIGTNLSHKFKASFPGFSRGTLRVLKGKPMNLSVTFLMVPLLFLLRTVRKRPLLGLQMKAEQVKTPFSCLGQN